jgi:HAE1 family hydrophobic/amphiphilic exporter-1
MFVEFFIKRPIFAAVCSILIVLAGAVCIPTLPIAQYPQIALPQVSVSSFYTGANAEVVESAVTIPLEQAINGAEGMKYISSVSGNDGSSSITITFDPSRNLDVAAVDVQNRVATATARLPNEVKQTGVTVTKNSSSFVLAMALFPEHGEYDQKFISNYADVYLKDAIKRVPGIADVQIFGERKFAMRVWINPEKLAQRGLAATDVVEALQEQNLQVPAGQIGQPPAPREKDFQFSLQVHGRLAEASEFENVVLKANPDGTLVRLKDVGRAELGAEDYSTFLRFNGRTAVGLGILQLPSANALDVRNNVLKTIKRLAEHFPPGLKWVDAFDTTEAVSASIRDVVWTLVEAILLVVLVIYVFLQTANSTLIPSITIPVSLVGTFAFVKLFGFSINTLTLFGLTLATGLVVDDAIVVIENIQRHLDEEGMALQEAATAAMREVSGAVIATSLVLMAVFAPVAFLPGTTGRIYQQFSLTIAFSVALSLFNSLTLTPALSARLLRKTTAGRNAFFRAFDAALNGVRNIYVRLLRWLLRWRTVTLLSYAGVVGAAVWLFLKVPIGFLPEEDQGFFIVMAQGPSGASLGYTERVLDEMEKILGTVPEVNSMFEVGGFSFGGNGPNRGITFVDLKPWDQRLGPGQKVGDIIQKLRGPLFANQHAMMFPFSPPALQGVGNFGGFAMEIEAQGGGSIQELADATQGFVQAASKSDALEGVSTFFTADDPQIYLNVNRERAKQLNVPLTDIFQTLQIYTGSEYVNDFTFSNRSYRVYVQADQQFRGNPKDLTSFYTRSRGGTSRGLTSTGLPMPGAAPAAGSMVSLDTLLTLEPRASAGEISHYNLFRSTEINGSPAPGRSSGEGLAAMEKIANTTLPQGYGFEWTGIAQEQIDAGNLTVLIFALALALVFLVLAAQYESFSLPFIVLLSVPLGLVGALGGQLLRGQSNDVFCQVGLVMLIGLSAKNAILIVEFANQLRERGHAIADAAIESARERLRPILMTSFAFILGVFPLVIAKGSGAEARHSLGTTVFGGMIVSTTMNLFFVPALYAMIEGARERVLHGAPHRAGAEGTPPGAGTVDE